MKNKNSRLSKTQLQCRKNKRMSMTRAQRKYAFILVLVVPRIIKGKLGISMRTSDGRFLAIAKAIHAALVADAGGFYTPPFGGLATLVTQITAFDDAIGDFLKGVLGGEAAKREAKLALKITLDAALAYINNLAFLDQVNAAEIITGAKMELVKVGSVKKQELSVKAGTAIGEIKLSSLAGKYNGKRVTTIYYWTYSIDNGITWVSLDNTSVAKTTATGMALNVRTLFRKRIHTVKGGLGPWCDPIAFTLV